MTAPRTKNEVFAQHAPFCSKSQLKTAHFYSYELMHVCNFCLGG